MFGLSQGLVNDVGNVVQGWLKNPLNRSFFFWYFLPAVGFVYLQFALVGPALGYHSSLETIYAAAPQANPDLSPVENFMVVFFGALGQNIVGLILIPLVLGGILAALSGTVLRLFQGSLPGVQWLLRPLTTRNRNRSRSIYHDLKQLRDEYLLLASMGLQKVVVESKAGMVKLSGTDLEEALTALKNKIQKQHEDIEEKKAGNALPVTLERVGPTDLGNILAASEEYPFERYGMDAMVFWPRLRAELEPEKIEPLDSGFAIMSGLLNMALLAGLFGLETFAICLYSGFQGTSIWSYLVGTFLAVFVAAGSYRAAVSSAVSLGNNFKIYFDYERGRVLERFGLIQPQSIDEERVLWLKLAAFLRRGESFYFPSEWRKS